MGKKKRWSEIADEMGIPPFDAADIILDVSAELTDENLSRADELFKDACERYLAEKR
jgi:hypothetical protein